MLVQVVAVVAAVALALPRPAAQLPPLRRRRRRLLRRRRTRWVSLSLLRVGCWRHDLEVHGSLAM
jgi:hypothetical protein